MGIRRALILFLLFCLAGCRVPGAVPLGEIVRARPLPQASESGQTKALLFTFSGAAMKSDCQPGLLVSNMGTGYAVSLNGRELAPLKTAPPAFVEKPDYSRLLPVPQDLVSTGANTVALRFSASHSPWQARAPRVYAGDYRDLALLMQDRAFASISLEIVLLTTLTFFFLAALALVASGMRQGEYLAFVLLMALYLAMFILDSRLFYETGGKSPFVQSAVYALTMAICAAIVLFIFAVNKAPLSRPARLLIALSVLAGIALLFVRTREGYLAFEPAALILTGADLALASFVALRAVKRRHPESGFVGFGFIGLASAIVLMESDLARSVEWNPFKILDLGFFLFLLAIECGLMARYARTYRRWRHLSRSILQAQQEERLRLSRDIHDGIGQSLIGVRLKLQLLAGGKGSVAGGLPPLIEELTRIMAELRQMVTRLRPVLTEEMNLSQLITWLAEKMEKQSDIIVHTDLDPDLDLPPEAKDNLFRLCQEAMANAARHSGAQRLDVSLRRKNRRLRLTVRDNGRGFSTLAHLGRGTGLLSMEERTELLGGRFSIQSSPGMGCVINVEVPVP